MAEIDDLVRQAALDDDTAPQAWAVLRESRPEALSAVAAALRSAPAPAQWQLSQALLRMSGPQFVPELTTLIRDSSFEIRLSAHFALATSVDSRALDVMLANLTRGRIREQAWAAEGLGLFGDRAAAPALEARLTTLIDEGEHEYNIALTAALVVSLARLGVQGYDAPIRELVVNGPAESRVDASKALPHITGRAILGFLEQVATDANELGEVREDAIYAMFLAGSQESFSVLSRLASDDDPQVAERALSFFGGLAGLPSTGITPEEANTWWRANRERIDPSFVHRLGTHLRIADLVDLLQNNESWDVTFAELKLVTGKHFGTSRFHVLHRFERAQVAREISRWWNTEARSEFVVGGLYKHGVRYPLEAMR
jgi:HEAT repeat protein